MAESKLEETLAKEFTAELKPDTAFNRAKSDITKVENGFFAKYDGKPVEEAKVPDAFNEVSKTYLSLLYGDFKGGNPINYGSHMRLLLNNVSETAFEEVKRAIKSGKRDQVLALFNRAIERQYEQLTAVLEKIRAQPSDVHLGTMKAIAKEGGIDNVAKVVANPAGFAQGLAQQYAFKASYN